MIGRTTSILLLLIVTGCAGAATDQASQNRNRLASVMSAYGSVQSLALAYMQRPICGQSPSPVCATPSIMSAIQRTDSAANAAINRANAGVKAAPGESSTTMLIDAASSAVDDFRNATPQGK